MHFFGDDMNIKFILTGGRDYEDWDKIKRVLKRIVGHSFVAVGDCPTGLDWFVRDFLLKYQIKVYVADWTKHGRPAGPIRNKEMVLANPGAIVIAFPGGRGTEDCVANGRREGNIVLRVLK